MGCMVGMQSYHAFCINDLGQGGIPAFLGDLRKKQVLANVAGLVSRKTRRTGYCAERDRPSSNCNAAARTGISRAVSMSAGRPFATASRLLTRWFHFTRKTRRTHRHPLRSAHGVIFSAGLGAGLAMKTRIQPDPRGASVNYNALGGARSRRVASVAPALRLMSFRNSVVTHYVICSRQASMGPRRPHRHKSSEFSLTDIRVDFG